MIYTRRIFNEGHAAYCAGKSLAANPYHLRRSMDAHSDWSQGWNHAKIEMEGYGKEREAA